MKKQIIINIRSGSHLFPGQGVGSAFMEHCRLCRKLPEGSFIVRVNSLRPADIVHCHSVEPWNLFYMKFMCRTGVMHCHFLPSTLEGSIKMPALFTRIFNRYVVHFYKSADRLVVVNPSFIRPLEALGINRERITYIPNYVTGDEFGRMSDEEISVIRKKLRIDEGRFTVLGVGQIMHRKGVDDFISLARRMPDVNFIWCGGFPFGALTEGYAGWKDKINNPPENLTFPGIVPRNQMNEYYNACDCFLLPSFDELFPMCILEAARVRKPVLLRDLPLYDNILGDTCARAGDVPGFESQLRRIRSDADYREALSCSSSRISETYSEENVLSLLAQFYAG